MLAPRIIAGIVTALAAMLMMTGVAHAEFTAQNKSTKGKGELLELTLEAGGAKVACSALKEGSSEIAWAIKNSKEAAEKGSHLILTTSKWGKCTAEASKLKSTEASIGGCQLELTEIGEEVSVPAKVLTVCTIKAGACAITVEPKENEKLNSINTYPSGEKNVNTVLQAEVANVATKTSPECGGLGISATNEGRLSGTEEMREVQVQRANQFTISANPLVYSATVTTGSFTIRRVASGSAKYKITHFVTINGNFSRDIFKLTTCGNLTFASGQQCSVDLTYNLTGQTATIGVLDLNDVLAIVMVRGT